MSIDFLEIRTNIIYSCFLYINAMKITLFINFDFFQAFKQEIIPIFTRITWKQKFCQLTASLCLLVNLIYE